MKFWRRLPITKIFFLAVLWLATGSLAPGTAMAASDDAAQNPSDTVPAATSRVVEAANAFLATLDEKQRAKELYAFSDDNQRARWSNFPTGFVPRGGLSLRELSDTQRSAAMALVSSALSPKGFEKVRQIMQADDVFKVTAAQGPPPFAGDKDGGKDRPPFGRDKGGGPDHPPSGGDRDGKQGRPSFGDAKGKDHGGPPFGNRDGEHGHPPALSADLFGKDLYYISILGTPSEKNPWMLQFGGHHLALNLTITGEQGVLTPTLTGAQPATYTEDGKTVRPLGPENDKAFALLNVLDEPQRKEAILRYQVADLVLGPGHDGETIQPEGLKASAMNEQQRAMLLDLVSEWVGIVGDRFAAAKMAEIKADLDSIWFAWSGATTVEPGKNGTAYYRIQGPRLVIEYAPQHEADHVHTMYRDPTNDYGRASAKP